MLSLLSTTSVRSGGAALRRARSLLRRVEQAEQTLEDCADDDLRRQFASLRYQAKCGKSLDRLLPRAFAIVRETAARRLNLPPFDTQLLAGVFLAQGRVTEMATGEGKTLAAVAPLALHALAGRGAHLVTANDYLAGRDADWMRPVYEQLGLSVGVIQSGSTPEQRRAAYACDITYGSAKEFGFDFLRDRLRGNSDGISDQRENGALQRPLQYVIVDEADSILIDEARIPLLISHAETECSPAVAAASRWAAEVVSDLREFEHFTAAPDGHHWELTPAGRAAIRRRIKPSEIARLRLEELYEGVEVALLVDRRFRSDQDYVVRDGEVVIVDEFSGRPAEGRRWRGGLHQAIEAREGLEISPLTKTAAQITIQEFFGRYETLAGMSGTIISSAREIQTVYHCRSVRTPLNRPCRRVQWEDQTLLTAEQKWQAVVKEIETVRREGRPVLVGTRSIDKSERLSQLLRKAGIEHNVLNAHHLRREAELIAAAGRPGQVTVATNMAGRGTDIPLAPGVREIGGLHVVATELHEAARIDQQLFGRAARQGDPGSYRVFLSWEDDILTAAFGDEGAARLREAASKNPRAARSSKLFYAAQKRVERKQARQRRQLWKQDRRRQTRLEQLGLDPFVDVDEDSLTVVS